MKKINVSSRFTAGFALASLVAMGGAFSGCASSAMTEETLYHVRELNTKVGKLQDTQHSQAEMISSVYTSLKNQADMVDSFTKMQDSMIVLQGRIDELNARTQMLAESLDSATGSAAGASRLDSLEMEVKAVNLRLEKINDRIKRMSTKLYLAMGLPDEPEIEGNALDPATMEQLPLGSETLAEGAPAQGAEGEQGQSSVDPGELYQRAYGAYLAGLFDDAISGFGQYIKLFPSTELSDNAAYWLGESHMGKGAFEEAVTAFDKMAELYPDSNKAPTALLRASDASLKLGDKGGAELRLKTIIEKYPTAHESGTADIKLKKL